MTREFKVEAVRLNLEHERSVSGVPRDLGISETVLPSGQSCHHPA